MPVNNLFSDIEFLSKKPVVKKIIKSKKFNVVRVCLEKGVEIKPHPEPYAVFFLVLEGSGIFHSKQGEFELKKNDSLFIIIFFFDFPVSANRLGIVLSCNL